MTKDNVLTNLKERMVLAPSPLVLKIKHPGT